MKESSRNPLFYFFYFINLINFANKFIAAQSYEYKYSYNNDSTLRSTYICINDGGNYRANSPYQQNLKTLLSSLPITTSTNYGFANSSAGQVPDIVNSITLCRGDIDQHVCRMCISNSTADVTQFCPSQKEAMIWYDECMVWYSNRSLSGGISDEPEMYLNDSENATDAAQFMAALRNLTDRLKEVAAGGGPLRKFATGSVPGPAFYTIYGLMQCTPDLTPSQCKDCLSRASVDITWCCDGKVGGRVRWPSCNLGYDITKFFTDPPAIALPSRRRHHHHRQGHLVLM